MTAKEWLDLFDTIGVGGLMAFGAFAVHRRWLVPGWVYRECEEREREWHDVAVTQQKALERIAARQSKQRRDA